jgi:hypothetical protein
MRSISIFKERVGKEKCTVCQEEVWETCKTNGLFQIYTGEVNGAGVLVLEKAILQTSTTPISFSRRGALALRSGFGTFPWLDVGRWTTRTSRSW